MGAFCLCVASCLSPPAASGVDDILENLNPDEIDPNNPKQLHEKLVQLKTLLKMKGNDLSPAQEKMLKELENLEPLTSSLSSGVPPREMEVDETLNEILHVCVMLSMRHQSRRHKSSTLGALQRLVASELPPS